MSRYIDAEKLKQEMYHEAFETDSDMQKWDSGCWIRYKMFENCIAQQPTVDAVEVVHGRWIDKGEYAVCTECGGRSGTQYDGVEPIPLMTQFCPNCGAKMDGEP